MAGIDPIIDAGPWLEGILDGDKLTCSGIAHRKSWPDWSRVLQRLMKAGRDIEEGPLVGGRRKDGDARHRRKTPKTPADRKRIATKALTGFTKAFGFPKELLSIRYVPLEGAYSLAGPGRKAEKTPDAVQQFQEAATALYRIGKVYRLATTCLPDGSKDYATLRGMLHPLGAGGKLERYTFFPGLPTWIDLDAEQMADRQGHPFPTVPSFEVAEDGSPLVAKEGLSVQIFNQRDRWKDDAQLPALALEEIDQWCNRAVTTCPHHLTVTSNFAKTGRGRPLPTPEDAEETDQKDPLTFRDGLTHQLSLAFQPRTLLEFGGAVWFWGRGDLVICEHCGMPFLSKDARSRFCDSVCRNAFRRAREAAEKPKTE